MNERESILIVEDSPMVGRTVERAVAKHCRTVLVTDIQQAKIAIAREQFIAIITDVGLPDGSGFEVIAEARGGDPGIPALVMSGQVDAGRLVHALTFSAFYILKPVGLDQVDLFVAGALSRFRHRGDKIDACVLKWADEYGLTPAQSEILAMTAKGEHRPDIASKRDVTMNTLKRQVSAMLEKTGDSSLETLSNRLLRAALADDC